MDSFCWFHLTAALTGVQIELRNEMRGIKKKERSFLLPVKYCEWIVTHKKTGKR